MPIPVIFSPKMGQHVARSYQKVERVLFEYIDNSIDSAEKFFNESLNSYNINIEIRVEIDNRKKEIKFVDNCLGMTSKQLISIVQNIGDSEKAGDKITNGQFGFGINSFMAIANRMTIKSSTKNCSRITSITIDANKAYIKDGKIEDEKYFQKPYPFNEIYGTEVTISEFKKDRWKEFQKNKLQKEIEIHFEQLLKRKNISVKIIEGNTITDCEGFDYENFQGVEFKKNIDTLISEKGVITYLNENPVRVYFKISEVILDKPPIFTNKGRRITEIWELKKFQKFSKRGKSGGSVWASPYLTGFIEVSGRIEPTLERADFEKSDLGDLIYKEIINQFEDLLHEKLTDLNKRDENAGYGNFENFLSQILNNLAKSERLKLKDQYETNPEGDYNINTGVGNSQVIDGISSNETKGNNTENKLKGENNGDEINSNELEDSKKASIKSNNGVNIKFSEQLFQDKSGNFVRSQYIEGDAIYIYREHEEFKKRKHEKNPYKITDSLLSYLAAEIAIHFKDESFKKNKKQYEDMDRKQQFSEIVEFIYSFENMLRPSVGKDIITLKDIEDDENK